MGKKVNIDGLTKAIVDELAVYKQDVTDGLKEEVKSAAEECAKAIKRTAPVKTGKYKKSWRATTVYESNENIIVEVYSKKEYRRTHLLEDGHDIKKEKNGAVVGHVRAYPHIAPAEEMAAKRLEKKVKIVVGGK